MFSGIKEPENIAHGIIPTVNTFSTPPSNLENVTGGDPTIPTGYGSKTVGGAEIIGQLFLDLGTNETMLVYVKLGAYVNAGTLSIYLDVSDDGNTYRTNTSTITTTAATSEVIRDCIPFVVTGRYLRVRANLNQAGTGNIRFYELAAFKLKL